jgi:hypothetical protein
MPRHAFVVLTNAVAGREDEFNEWYTNRHIPDVLTLPGIVAAQRFKLSEQQRRDPPYPWQYLAIYEAETDDLSVTINALKDRSGTASMPTSTAMAEQRVAWFYTPITERLTAKSETGD